MKFKKIVCVGFDSSELESFHWTQIDELTEKRALTSDIRQAISKHSDADALLVKLGAKVDSDIVSKFQALKYIGMLGTGFGGIDTKYTSSKGVTVTNIANYATEGVAEFTLAIILEHLRSISLAKTQASQGNYSDEGFKGGEIKGKKWGVIGLGNIGKRTAEIAKVLGAKVVYWSRNRKKEVEDCGIKYVELDTLLSGSDIITLNLAYNPDTEEIIDKKRMSLFKKGAIVVNPSPMELVDFAALKARLARNDITFILDHSDEMTEEQLDELKPFENCIIYPPIAYLTTEAGNLKKDIYVDNLKNYLKGKPSNKVN